MSDEKKLLQLKTDIEAAESKLNRLQGKEEFLVSQLKENYKCNTTQEAEEIVKKWEKKKDKIEEELTDGIEELEKLMGDDN